MEINEFMCGIMDGAITVPSLTKVPFPDAERFKLSREIVEDKYSGLMWSRNANIGTRNWDGAILLILELRIEKYAGYNDWRLPTEKEFQSLVTYAKSGGYDGSTKMNRFYQLLNQMGFNKVQSGFYWLLDSVVGAKYIGMNGGNVITGNKENNYNVWPVRGKLSSAIS